MKICENQKCLVRTTISKSAVEFEAASQLWRDVYGEEFGWLGKSSRTDEDYFHDRSHYAVCWHQGRPVGTLRIVSQAQPDFYITNTLNGDPLNGLLTHSVEIQRLMVHKDYREKRICSAPFGIYGCLVKACFQHALATGVDWVLADCHKDMTIGPLKSMKMMGFIETGHEYVSPDNNESCIVMLIRTKDWVKNIVYRSSPFNSYLFNKDPNLKMEL